MAGVGLPERAINFSLFHGVQTDFGAHPASYPTGFSPGWDMKLTTHLHTELRTRMVELYLYSPYVFVAWCLIN
jgi:hypothetical protein